MNRRQRDPAEQRALARLRAGDVDESQTIRAGDGWEHEHADPARDPRRARRGRQSPTPTGTAPSTSRSSRSATPTAKTSPTASAPSAPPAASSAARHSKARAGDPTPAATPPATASSCTPTSAAAASDRCSTAPPAPSLRRDRRRSTMLLDRRRPASSCPPDSSPGRRPDGTPNVSHAWARTVDGAQGGTWRQVHLLGTPALDRHTGYVGQCRGPTTHPHLEHPPRHRPPTRPPRRPTHTQRSRRRRAAPRRTQDPRRPRRPLAPRPPAPHRTRPTRRHRRHPTDRPTRRTRTRTAPRSNTPTPNIAPPSTRSACANKNARQLGRSHTATARRTRRHHPRRPSPRRRATPPRPRRHHTRRRVRRVSRGGSRRANVSPGTTNTTGGSNASPRSITPSPITGPTITLRSFTSTTHSPSASNSSATPPPPTSATSTHRLRHARTISTTRSPTRTPISTTARTISTTPRQTSPTPAPHSNTSTQRHRFRRDKGAITAARDALHTAEDRLAGRERSRGTVPATPRRPTTGRQAWKWPSTRRPLNAPDSPKPSRDLYDALDHTRPERIVAATTDPTHDLWTSLGPPPTTRGGLAAWCGIAEQLETWNDRHLATEQRRSDTVIGQQPAIARA